MDTRGLEDKKKRKKNSYSSDSSHTVRKKEAYLVRMIAVTQTDGIFKDPQAVGKFVAGKLEDVRSVKITRSGMVIIDCVSKWQREKALKIRTFNDYSSVTCFPLRSEAKKKKN